MKILLINKFHYQKGGSETYLFSLAELLRAHGHEVIHFSMQSQKNIADPNEEYFSEFMDLHRFSLKNIIRFFRNGQALRQLERLIEKEKPDLAHLHNIAHQLTPAIIPLLKKHGIPVVQTLHDYKLICPNSQLYNTGGDCQRCLGGKYYNCFKYSCMHDSKALSFLGMLEAYYNQRFTKPYDLVDRFIAPSAYMKEVSVAFGVAGERIEVIRNFIPEKWLSQPKARALAFASDYLLYYGRLSSEKGVADIIEALRLQKSKDLRLLIAGTGPLAGELKQKIADSGLGERVQLIGFRSGQELLDLIQGAKAVVLPSRWPENMPYSLLESMAMSKIVIAARVGGMSEMIEAGQSSFLFKAGNCQDLAEKIDNLMALDATKFEEMASKSRLLAEENGPEKHYQEIIKLYEQVNENNLANIKLNRAKE